MDRTESEVRKSIERYKATGKLPREYDVIQSYQAAYDEDEPNYIENVPRAEPYESLDAGLLADHLDEFVDTLAPKQRRVYDLHMSGGLTLSETADILGVKPPTVSQSIDEIRAKARGIIEKYKKQA
jgi:RNA polymerase sigma factor (sigma-70 family)